MTLRQNPYQGINPHLNSLLQTSGTTDQPAMWSTFHARHITYICDFLNDGLPSNYIALSEQSLQVMGDDWGGKSVVKRPKPDVSVFRTRSAPVSLARSIDIQATWEAELIDVLDPEKMLTGVVIREVNAQAKLGKIVTRLELLSPANKMEGSQYSAYRIKRLESLQVGIPLVEIDYLHETTSPIENLPHYPDEARSYPYYIAVTDPRPTWNQGEILVYGFGVNMPVTKAPIPLKDDEVIGFDFNPVYQHTFERGRWNQLLDYTEAPLRFDTYRGDDQTTIHDIMQTLKTS